MQKKRTSDRGAPKVARMVEEIVGCKWTVSLLRELRRGIRRPGALQRALPGISTKVLNERLRKLARYGIVERTVYPESPPRVEYQLTEFGHRFIPIIDQIEALEREFAAGAEAEPAPQGTRSPAA